MSSQYVVTGGAKREVERVSGSEEWVVVGYDEIQLMCQVLYDILPQLLSLLHDHNCLHVKYY